ncbi:hypothetical protein QNA23_10560 [Rhodococcus erythropolis]|uniref:hypothetical protein n=1 Tax=Rhodococcus erythropolis TaxID=1833 RepID=UPI0024BB6077|nr:hypothetical protein [Rhodococcus erythropolis]MDJ0403923.1 hypothetical protein [Rhodococcus erythropolis]
MTTDRLVEAGAEGKENLAAELRKVYLRYGMPGMNSEVLIEDATNSWDQALRRIETMFGRFFPHPWTEEDWTRAGRVLGYMCIQRGYIGEALPAAEALKFLEESFFPTEPEEGREPEPAEEWCIRHAGTEVGNSRCSVGAPDEERNLGKGHDDAQVITDTYDAIQKAGISLGATADVINELHNAGLLIRRLTPITAEGVTR